jgi:predicted transcriptional regulator of viral defense system
MDMARYVEALVSKGRYHFSASEAAKAVGATSSAAAAALRRMRQKGSLAMPCRGFNVFVPPEYRKLGCLPPEQFVPQLMNFLGLRYYVGLLSAAEIHGAAHQRPQVFQVVVAANRRRLECGAVQVQFIARRNAAQIPSVSRNTARGYMVVSSPEATAFDLAGYVRHCGGLNNVATVLGELAGSIDPGKLADAAALSPLPWAQRLGDLLEITGNSDLTKPLAEHVAKAAREYVPLGPRRQDGGSVRSAEWKLIVNDKVEADL